MEKDNPPPGVPPGATPSPDRKGALWEYLVSTGMTPEEADAATADQR